MIVQRSVERLRELWRSARPAGSPEAHLDAAVRWLFAAQDATTDAGVSHSYLIGKGWMRSYPETTGYIIPTLLNWARYTGQEEAERRALQMADWELDCQLDSGAIPELSEGQPTVFDTGQVLFGWIAAFLHSADDRYVDAARRGAEWLLLELDQDGVWRHPSDSGGAGRVYNVRVAWALLELSKVTGNDRYEAPARGFLDWSLEQVRGPGWFDRNCLTDDEAPLLHTIAYTARGQLESGLLLDDARLVDAARDTARQLLERLGADGRLSGRFDANWKPTVPWACLTGMAQTCVIWHRLAAQADRGDAKARAQAESFREAAAAASGFLMRVHDVRSQRPDLRGGVRGSYPVSGAYGRWRVLNWATKFFVDALLVQMQDTSLHYRG